MIDPTCANCTYESSEISEDTGFCQTCQRAYEIGYSNGKAEQ